MVVNVHTKSLILRNMNKRIVYIVSNFPCYSETFILRELLELRRRGYFIKVLSLRRPHEGIVQEKAEIFLKDTVYVPFFSPKILFSFIWFLIFKRRTLLSLLWGIIKGSIKAPSVLLKNLAIFPKSCYFAKMISTQGFFHIHAHFGNFPATSAYIISSLLNIPYTFTVHAHDIFFDTTFLDKKIEASRKVVAISRYNKDFILKKFSHIEESKIEIIHCGLDLGKFRPQDRLFIHHPLRILSVGRIVPTKGFDNLVRMCFFLKNKGLDFVCQIIGSGPYERTLRRLINNLGLKKHIYLLGPKVEGEIIRFYKEADFFILLTRKERTRDVQDGIPVSLIEAMAMGLLVISTPVSGIPELIEDRETGFLVGPHQYKKAGEIILQLSRDENLREKINREARKKIAKDFSLKDSINRLERIFNA